MTKLPDGWRWVRLGDICSEDRQGILPNLPESELLPYLGLEHIESETGRILRNGKDGLRDEIQSNTFAFTPKHVLYGKLRPYLNKVALPSYSGKCSTELIPILPSKQIIREFLAWILRRSETVEIVMRGVTGSRMPRAKMKELFAMTVPLPPIEHQRRIVAVLDEKLAAVAQARQAAQAQLEAAQALPAAYLRAIFDSPEAQSWPRYRLGDVGSVLAGITKGRKLKIGTVVFSVPYLRVANVQDGYLNLSEITYIEATEREIELYQLERGDLLLTEGGDPDKLGRGTFWEEQISGCIYQNHLFRVRFDDNQYNPVFLSAQISSPYGKAYFLANSRQTTGIATINRRILSNFPLMTPPMEIQQQIAEDLSEQSSKTEHLTNALIHQLETVEAMPAAYLRKAFNGEL